MKLFSIRVVIKILWNIEVIVCKPLNYWVFRLLKWKPKLATRKILELSRHHFICKLLSHQTLKLLRRRPQIIIGKILNFWAIIVIQKVLMLTFILSKCLDNICEECAYLSSLNFSCRRANHLLKYLRKVLFFTSSRRSFN